MSLFRYKGQSVLTVNKPVDEVFSALLTVARKIGKLKQENRVAGYFVIRTGMRIFPSQNPATVRVSIKGVEQKGTEISFQSDTFDGLIGFGSAGKAIDSIVCELETLLG